MANEVIAAQVHNITPDLQPLATPIAKLLPDPSNANTHPPEQLRELAASLTKYGQRTPLVVTAKDNIIRKGNGTWEAAFTLLGWSHIAAVFVDEDETTATGYSIADNRTAQLSVWDNDTLARILKGFDQPLDIPGVTEDWLASLPSFDLSDLAGLGTGSSDQRQEAAKNKLTSKFIVPPFSVLDSRQGYWQDRKRNWLGLGIQSELGRGTAPGGSLLPATDYSDQQRGDGTGKPIMFQGSQARLNELMGSAGFQTGASVFDPVICELAYRWFSPEGGTVLDPFAGGSVRGVVAGMLGRQYTGIDLSERQIEANRQQVEQIFSEPAAPANPDAARQLSDPAAITPIDEVGDYWVKRDDLFSIAGARGGKVRTCYQLAKAATFGLVTAGARKSPQVLIVAKIAQQLGLQARLHVPSGALTDELKQAAAAGGELIQHKPGYNSVIVARANTDAEILGKGWQLIPFGMETDYAVTATAAQVTNIPSGVKRIVIPVGSGMSLAGLLVGLQAAKLQIPVIGVVVGADPEERLNKYAPANWRERVTLVMPEQDYEQPAPVTDLLGVELDYIYEAKCIPFLQPGDLLWVVGNRNDLPQPALPQRQAAAQVEPVYHVGDSLELLRSLPSPSGGYDFLFTCPPYGDLEVYSDNPADISNMEHGAFMQAYREIIRLACSQLADNRFAAIVVGDFRDKEGLYRNFVSDTVKAFLDAGLQLYNEGILVTAIGSLPIRISGQFSGNRKLGKTHQNFLVFVKGDPAAAVAACGNITVELPEGMLDEEVVPLSIAL